MQAIISLTLSVTSLLVVRGSVVFVLGFKCYYCEPNEVLETPVEQKLDVKADSPQLGQLA